MSWSPRVSMHEPLFDASAKLGDYALPRPLSSILSKRPPPLSGMRLAKRWLRSLKQALSAAHRRDRRNTHSGAFYFIRTPRINLAHSILAEANIKLK